ncbi:HNH endonuclease [Scytonema millei]|uniref:HNH endonuclease n=1 Tax=Scytonema millei VB511283 TaxID=1245923 RepID=A0A9X5I5Z3_9CYAN|nr:HNH endonuclease signature motif containing protein [Scytonema millei]NHC37048.1 HNH endonuclease [Scytonema millei VB511283]
MAFLPNDAEKALLDCGRCCCICHKFCSFKIELHHIIQRSEGGEDSYENCIPLCLDCHAEVKAYDPKHPKGRKYTESELMEHRNRWYEKVKNVGVLLVHPECIELDRNSFLKLKEILPVTGGSIAFIRNHIYNCPWLKEAHDDLNNYMLYCQNPDFEFIDIDLEIYRCKLTECIEKFIDALLAVSFTTDRWTGEQLEIAVYPEIKYSKPDIYHKAVNDIHQTANKVCSAYDNLIRLGRRKLAVE